MPLLVLGDWRRWENLVISGLIKTVMVVSGRGRIKKMRRGMPIWGAARPTPSGFLAAFKVATMSSMMPKTFLSSFSTGLASWRRMASGAVRIRLMGQFYLMFDIISLMNLLGRLFERKEVVDSGIKTKGDVAR